jgi:hypothetical protein
MYFEQREVSHQIPWQASQNNGTRTNLKFKISFGSESDECWRLQIGAKLHPIILREREGPDREKYARSDRQTLKLYALRNPFAATRLQQLQREKKPHDGGLWFLLRSCSLTYLAPCSVKSNNNKLILLTTNMLFVFLESSNNFDIPWPITVRYVSLLSFNCILCVAPCDKITHPLLKGRHLLAWRHHVAYFSWRKISSKRRVNWSGWLAIVYFRALRWRDKRARETVGRNKSLYRVEEQQSHAKHHCLHYFWPATYRVWCTLKSQLGGFSAKNRSLPATPTRILDTSVHR